MIDRACISLNHRCNLHCKYCHFAGKESDIPDAEYELAPSEAEKIVDNIAQYCSTYRVEKFKLGIVGSGEPLLSFATLIRIVESIDEVGNGVIKAYTISNGTCLTKEMADFFYRNRRLIDLSFSLDGDKPVHTALRQGFYRTMRAIDMYESFFHCKPLINATVTRHTITHADETIAFFLNNGFSQVNFSIVTDINDPTITITKAEYEDFLNKCQTSGIVMRQRRNDLEKVYDCAKYGRLCGVGHTNVFFTKQGVFPCGRFFGLPEYKLGEYDAPLRDIEAQFTNLNPIANGECYFDKYVRQTK